MRVTITGRNSVSVSFSDKPEFLGLAQAAIAAESRIVPVVVIEITAANLMLSSVQAEAGLEKIKAALVIAADETVKEQLLFSAAVLSDYASGRVPAWV